MFAAAPSTKVDETAEETGTMRAAAGATALNSTPAMKASASDTNPESVVTKVAKAEQTNAKNQPRTRIFAIAASAVVLIVLIAVAAGVYTFTRNATVPTPTNQGSVEGAPTVPPTSTTDNQSIPDAAGTKAESSPTPDSPVIIIRQGEPHAKKGKSQPVRKGENDVDVDIDEPPDPPETDETPETPRRARKFPLPGTPEFDEAMRQAAEARRAGEEARRAAREQRRLILIQKQREMQREREKQRQRQIQQP